LTDDLANGLHRWSSGDGGGEADVLCIHESAAAGEIWRPLAAALPGDVTLHAYDRRGWGRSPAPEGYSRTTVSEQAGDAESLIESIGSKRLILCGAGIGAVVALELMLRRADAVAAALLIEPPLLAFDPEATEGLSADSERVAEAVAEGGPRKAFDLYVQGRLPTLGAGAGRIPPEIAEEAATHPLSLFAELAAVSAWELPAVPMSVAPRPSLIVAAEAGPAPLGHAAEGLAAGLARTQLRRVGPGLPHFDSAAAVADLITELIDSS
jgi:pimeloyl-ACP methyl ester carboxylesterase